MEKNNSLRYGLNKESKQIQLMWFPANSPKTSSSNNRTGESQQKNQSSYKHVESAVAPTREQLKQTGQEGENISCESRSTSTFKQREPQMELFLSHLVAVGVPAKVVGNLMAKTTPVFKEFFCQNYMQLQVINKDSHNTPTL